MVRDEGPAATPVNEAPVEIPVSEAPLPEAPEVPGGECGDGGQNLHDFVYSLLVDVECRSAFDQDPAAALADAGLSDICAADVQDVVPLVADSLPVGAQDLNLDGLMDGLVADGPAGAISQLQLVTQQLLVAGDSTGINIDIASAAGGLGFSTQGLSIDIDATSAFGGVSTTLGAPGGLALEGGLTVTGTFSSNSVVGEVAGALSGEAFGLEGNPVSETLSTGATNVSFVADNAFSDPVGAVTHAVTNPTDTVSAVSNQVQSLVPADLPADLPAGLPLGGLPTGALPTGGLPTGALPLGGALPLDALPVNALPLDALQTLPMDLPTTLPAGGIPADLPVDAVGTATGALQGAVGQVAGDLPVQLPTNLPTGDLTGEVGQVQDTVTCVAGDTGVSDVVTNSLVGDVVNQTGLGDVVNQVQPTDVAGTVSDVLPTDGLFG